MDTLIASPWFYAGLFLVASGLMLWRLESMAGAGLGGTVLGTLITPYCSGLGNLVFAVILVRTGGDGREVVINSFVNNITNLTILIGLPAVLWTGRVKGGRESRGGKSARVDPGTGLNRLSLLLTLVAALFFTGILWVVGRDGRIDFNDALILIGAFLFWQAFHVFEVLKGRLTAEKPWGWGVLVDVALLGVAAWGIYISVDWLVAWLGTVKSGLLRGERLGWLSGWLMVLPNSLLAFYYGWRRQPELTCSSQIGDGHICVPLCIGVFALFRPIQVPGLFETGIWLLTGAAAFNFVVFLLLGRVNRLTGLILVGAHAWFVYQGAFR